MHALKKIRGFVVWATISMFCVEIAIVVIQIISRNLIGRSYASMEELAVILLPYMGFFAATLTLYNGNHVQIDFFYQKFPQPMKRLLFFLSQAAMIAVIIILSYSSVKLSMKLWSVKTPANGWPLGIKYLCMPAAAPFMLPLLAHNLFRCIAGAFDDFQGLHPIRPRGAASEKEES